MDDPIRLTVNGVEREVAADPRTLLVHLVREGLGLTGTHVGCLTGDCGACTVLLDGRTVKSCSLLAGQADGREITTIEGLAEEDGTLHPVQDAFLVEFGFQCGYCVPGMVLTTTELLASTVDPTDAEIEQAINGNLCRCTGYGAIRRAVRRAADHASACAAACAAPCATGRVPDATADTAVDGTADLTADPAADRTADGAADPGGS